MKTKEQILLETTGRTRLSEFGSYAEDYIQAMQTYADQQTADRDRTIADLRRRLSDCERKRITGQRL